MAKKSVKVSLIAIAMACLAVPAPARQAGDSERVQVEVTDGRISMSAEAVTLAELLETLDRAVGTRSSVAGHLQSRNMSVRFRDLAFGDAVRKIFEGQSLDYIVVGQERIMVTAESGVAPPGGGTMARTASGSNSRTTATAAPRENINAPVPNPFQLRGNGPGQPVATPFGTIFNQGGNPAAGRTGQPVQSTPAQPSTLFGNTDPNPFNNGGADPTPPTPQQRGPIPGQGIPVQPVPVQPR
jgi:hypothetical protein